MLFVVCQELWSFQWSSSKLSLGGIGVLFSCAARSVTVHQELEFHGVWSRSQGSFCPINTWEEPRVVSWRLSPQHWEGDVTILSSFCVVFPLFAWLWLSTLYTHEYLFGLLFIFQQILGSLCHFSDRHPTYQLRFWLEFCIKFGSSNILSVSTYFSFFHLFYIFLIEVIDLH